LTEIQENYVNEERIVYARKKSQAALQQRADALEAQDELDSQVMEKNTGGNRMEVPNKADSTGMIDTAGQSMATDSQNKENICHDDDGKVQLSDDDDDDEAGNFLSQDSFADKVGSFTGKGLARALDKNPIYVLHEDKSQRFTDRLAGKDDMPILDIAINLATAKNLEGTSINFGTVLDSSDSTLLDIYKLLGVDLGVMIDLVSSKLQHIRAHE
jgi:hypothetical protein